METVIQWGANILLFILAIGIAEGVISRGVASGIAKAKKDGVI